LRLHTHYSSATAAAAAAATTGASSSVSIRASRRRYTNRAGRGQFSSRSFAVRIGSFSELLQRTVRPTVLLPASQNSK